MAPFKSGKVIANWGLRITLAALILFRCVPEVLDFNLESITFYIALFEMILSTLLFVGGFGIKEKAMVTVALLLCLLLVLSFFESWPGRINESVLHNLLLIFVSFYFVTNGNRN